MQRHHSGLCRNGVRADLRGSGIVIKSTPRCWIMTRFLFSIVMLSIGQLHKWCSVDGSIDFFMARYLPWEQGGSIAGRRMCSH